MKSTNEATVPRRRYERRVVAVPDLDNAVVAVSRRAEQDETKPPKWLTRFIQSTRNYQPASNASKRMRGGTMWKRAVLAVAILVAAAAGGFVLGMPANGLAASVNVEDTRAQFQPTAMSESYDVGKEEVESIEDVGIIEMLFEVIPPTGQS